MVVAKSPAGFRAVYAARAAAIYCVRARLCTARLLEIRLRADFTPALALGRNSALEARSTGIQGLRFGCSKSASNEKAKIGPLRSLDARAGFASTPERQIAITPMQALPLINGDCLE